MAHTSAENSCDAKMWGLHAWEVCMCWMEAWRGRSPAEVDQLGTHSGAPWAVMAYLGCCCRCCCLLSQAIRVCWGRGDFWAPHPLLFFSPGKAAMSPVITGSEFEVSGVYAHIFSLLKATRSPRACSVWLFLLQMGGTDSCHGSLGHCPNPVCLFTCLHQSAS